MVAHHMVGCYGAHGGTPGDPDSSQEVISGSTEEYRGSDDDSSTEDGTESRAEQVALSGHQSSPPHEFYQKS
jgi:hypothetical protein